MAINTIISSNTFESSYGDQNLMYIYCLSLITYSLLLAIVWNLIQTGWRPPCYWFAIPAVARKFSSYQLSPYLGLANLILCFCFCLRLCFPPMPINTFLCLSSHGDQKKMCILLIIYYLTLNTDRIACLEALFSRLIDLA